MTSLSSKCILINLAFVSVTTGYVFSQDRNVTNDVVIEQKDLLAGKTPLSKVLESGGQFFSAPYIPDDGYSEGPTGPRAVQRATMYLNGAPVNLPYLRVNGIDSQSCYECHNSIGTRRGPEYSTPALLRRENGIIGGSAGIVSTLFQNTDFPTRVTLFLRNPPHVFGSGYTQMLAEEMTFELWAIRDATIQLAKSSPGQQQEVKLMSKGTDFGEYRVTWDVASNMAIPDYSQVEGVNSDLRVRPLQNKGIASTVRSFVHSALDFHFSMQGVEIAGYNTDPDGDGRFNEMSVDLSHVKEMPLAPNATLAEGLAIPAINQSLGDVSALTSFVAMTRPPHQELPAGQEAQESVARGQEIFLGKNIPGLAKEAIGMCSSCHHATKPLDMAMLLIETPWPLPAPGSYGGLGTPKLGSGIYATSDSDPVSRRYREKTKLVKEAQGSKDRLAELMSNSEHMKSDYKINLTAPDPNSPTSLPRHVYPRLKPNADGKVTVPLFSDLKLHDMGTYLQDVQDQEVDVKNLHTPKREFLTRPLWGVGDTQPWLHDGRALTLRDAIIMHAYRNEEQKADDDSLNSSAFPVVKAFRSLTAAQQQDLVNFLLSLRLPDPGKSDEWANEPSF